MKILHTRTWSRALLFAALTVSFMVQAGCARTIANGNRNQSDTSSNSNPLSANANAAQSPSRHPSNSPEGDDPRQGPDEVVRQFYSWYLSELRAGKEPFKDEKIKQYATDDFLRENASGPAGFDPALLLPKPESDWYDMKVEVSKPKYYHKKPFHDAYVDVTYIYPINANRSPRKGTSSETRKDEWSVGLERAGASWKIASIGLKE